MATVVPLPPRRQRLSDAPHIVAMVHVPSTTALLCHSYTALLGVPAPAPAELLAVNGIVQALIEGPLAKLAAQFPMVGQVAPIPLKLRSLVFLLLGASSGVAPDVLAACDAATAAAQVAAFEALPFVRYLVDRALREVAIFVRHGIRVVEIENVAAPYFVGMGACPFEELLALFAVGRAVRRAYPALAIGIHVLSCNELEALPIALAVGGSFLRSEATLFGGMRPEGPTDNHGNLARFLYLRHVLRGLFLPETLQAQPCLAGADVYPKIWSDVQKKHTVFPPELAALDTWLHNITFMKLEGVIVTGAETGSDVDERSLAAARTAVDGVHAWNSKTYAAGTAAAGQEGGGNAGPWIPVVTGSGLAFAMYAKYADFMIVGTALKVGKYWENDVDEENVRLVVANVAAVAGQQVA